MELLDVSEQLPALMRMSGLRSWRVKVKTCSTANINWTILLPVFRLAGSACRLVTNDETGYTHDLHM